MNNMSDFSKRKCVYLDSSNIIRQINENPKQESGHLKYYQLKKDVFPSVTVGRDTMFYKRIVSLLNANVISKVITYETQNTAISNRPNEIIRLFKPNSNITVYLNQSVEHHTFFAAAQEIASSDCIIIDPLFLDFQVGIKLTNYIKSSCQVISLGKRIILQKYDGEITTKDQTPEKYVEELFNTINHFD